MANATLWVNNYSNKLIRNRTRSDGRQFCSVSFFCDAIDNWVNLGVSPKQVREAKRFSGSLIEGFSCILLGSPDVERMLSYKDENNEYQKICMTVQEIFDSIEQNRNNWKAMQQEAAPKKGRKATRKTEITSE